MDRDIVVLLDGLAASQLCVVARNDHTPSGSDERDSPPEAAHVLVAGFTPPRASGTGSALRLKVLVDCSGSMAGDSIDTARSALGRLLASCDSRDTITLARFGSEFEAGPAQFVPWTGDVRTAGTRWMRSIDADMGGTNLGPALTKVFESGGRDADNADVLLITDGEIWDDEGVLARAVAADQRIFVIAVGAAPAEGFLSRLARETGGAIEFVTPGEDLAHAIEALGGRLRQPRARDIAVRWPAEPVWSLPMPGAVFGGDTVYLVAGFDAMPAGAVELHWTDTQSRTLAVTIPTQPVDDDAIARVAAARRFTTLASEHAARFAECHQLVTSTTSMVLVLDRSEAEESALPMQTIAVPQMLAAGWGGTGQVQYSHRASSVMRSEVMSSCDELGAASDRSVHSVSSLNAVFDSIWPLAADRTIGHEEVDKIQELDEIRELETTLSPLRDGGQSMPVDLETFAFALAAWLAHRDPNDDVSFDALFELDDAIPFAINFALLIAGERNMPEGAFVAELLAQIAERFPAAGIPQRFHGPQPRATPAGDPMQARVEALVDACLAMASPGRQTEMPESPQIAERPIADTATPGRTRRLMRNS